MKAPFRSKLVYFFLLLAPVFLTFLGGCEKTRALPDAIRQIADSPDQSVLKMGFYGDPLDLNPIGHLFENARLVCNMVHAGPLRKTPSGEFVPDLFASWTFSQDEKGNLIVEGVWRGNLIWHDGQIFDPTDLSFTIDAMRNPENASPYAAIASKVVNISSFDRGRRIRLAFDGNSRQYLEILAAGLLPSHLLRGKKINQAAIVDNGSSSMVIDQASGPSQLFFDRPIGIGPFKIVDRKKGQFIHLSAWDVSTNSVNEANAQVTQPGSISRKISTVLLRSYLAVEDLVNDFRQGKLDWINVPSEIAVKLEELKIPQVRFVRYPNPSYQMWGFNTQKAPLNDLKIRKAFDLAIDRGKIKNIVPFEVVPMTKPQIGSAALDTAGKEITQDYLEAKRLLDESGVKDTNNDGIREFGDKPFEISILINQENIYRKMIGDIIIDDLRKIGIRGTVESLSWSEMIGKRLSQGDFQTFILGFQAPLEGNWINLWHSRPPLGEKLNFTGFSDERLDKALSEIDLMSAQTDFEGSRAVIMQLLAENLPGIFLFRPLDFAAFSTNLSGPSEGGEFWEQDISKWEKKSSAAK